MTPLDCLVLGGIAAACAYAAVWLLRRRARGEGGCGGCALRGNCGKTACSANRDECKKF